MVQDCHHDCSVMVSSPVEGDTNQGSNPGGSKKNLAAPPPKKNSGRAPACGTCAWFDPSYQRVAAVVASPVGRGHPRLQYGPISRLVCLDFFLGAKPCPPPASPVFLVRHR